MEILLVDDDQNFLESLKFSEIEGATLRVQGDPVLALEDLDKLNPAIIITDVMMPAIHGLKFLKIAKSILRHERIIVISGNSKAEVERDFGSLENVTFFPKPLKPDFWKYLEGLVSDIANMSSRDEAISVGSSVDKIDKIATHYQAYHQFMYEECALKNKSFYGEETWDKKERLERDLLLSLNLLFEDELVKESVLKDLDGRYKSWQSRVIENQSDFIRPFIKKLKKPFKIDMGKGFENCVLEVTSYEVKKVGNDEYDFLINNEDGMKYCKFFDKSKASKILAISYQVSRLVGHCSLEDKD